MSGALIIAICLVAHGEPTLTKRRYERPIVVAVGRPKRVGSRVTIEQDMPYIGTVASGCSLEFAQRADRLAPCPLSRPGCDGDRNHRDRQQQQAEQIHLAAQ